MGDSGKMQLVDRAVRELRARILAGELKPDTHISEAAAAEMMGVSRTPAREALAILVDEGLMLRSPSGRCTVRLFTRDDAKDAIVLRGVLEGTVLRLAVERGPDAMVLERCETILCRIDTALNSRDTTRVFEDYARLNKEFHVELSRVAGSDTLQRELHRAIRLPFASPGAFPPHRYNTPKVRNTFHRAQEQHRAMIGAVRAGEGSRVEALAREHARLAWEDYEAVMYEERASVENAPGFAMIAAAEATPAV
ncbi:GntR family transcriptional regulator [Psychromarinibacter sp. S121]|uniref:GntR family transcriptional regulator n=1 Tax=Psychromarinibacter sp. S121 TaxID=3415127 RepID=UPI003C7A183B